MGAICPKAGLKLPGSVIFIIRVLRYDLRAGFTYQTNPSLKCRFDHFMLRKKVSLSSGNLFFNRTVPGPDMTDHL